MLTWVSPVHADRNVTCQCWQKCHLSMLTLSLSITWEDHAGNNRPVLYDCQLCCMSGVVLLCRVYWVQLCSSVNPIQSWGCFVDVFVVFDVELSFKGSKEGPFSPLFLDFWLENQFFKSSWIKIPAVLNYCLALKLGWLAQITYLASSHLFDSISLTFDAHAQIAL